MLVNLSFGPLLYKFRAETCDMLIRNMAMASIPVSIVLAFACIPFVPSFVSPSLADNTPLVPPGTVCAFTRDPSYCRTTLPDKNLTIYDFGRFAVYKSLSQSRRFLSLVNSYLESRNMSGTVIRALEDCRFLGEDNLDLFSSSYSALRTANSSVPSSLSDDVQTWLSAVLTNQDTCFGGLFTAPSKSASDSTVKTEVCTSVSDDIKLHSLSLALFVSVWAPPKKIATTWQPNKLNLDFRNGRLPLKMFDRVRAIFDAARGHHVAGLGRRKLLQSSSNEGGNASVAINDIVVVSQDGSGNFTNINDAISAAPNNSAQTNGYFLVCIKAGVYEEYVFIASNKRYLMLLGDGINQTIITGNHSVGDGWTTFSSATFAVVAEGFVAANITFRNTAGPSKWQAVAVRNGADLSAFYSCRMEGYQDTLYSHSKRQFYRECDIFGTVDFIFGNSAVVLQNCNIYPRLPLSGQFNPISAQGRTDPNQNTGISVQNCTLTPSFELAPYVSTVKTYMGRPWKEYSRTVYMQSFMDSFLDPAGWAEWNGTFALSTLYYAEYNNTGPGSNTTNRVTWPGYHVINATDAANFTVSNFLQGDNWLPRTGVPYTAGLISY